MATRILIPTPLRPYTDKRDAVDAEGHTVGELLADMVLLSDDIFTIDHAKIRDVKVLKTIVGGKIVFGGTH